VSKASVFHALKGVRYPYTVVAEQSATEDSEEFSIPLNLLSHLPLLAYALGNENLEENIEGQNITELRRWSKI